jgi:hypothetical protein
VSIFSSAFAQSGALPTSDRGAVATLEPRATAPALGAVLHNAETITFRRLRDFEAKPYQCYLPWCVEDFIPREDAEYGETAGGAHMHRGAAKTMELHSREAGKEYVETASVHLSRYDDDGPATPHRGNTEVYVEFPGNNPIDPADLLRLTQVIAGQARIAIESRTRGRQLTGRHAVEIPQETGSCYLPWCSDCCPSTAVALGEFLHDHFSEGVEVAIDGDPDGRKTTMKVELERTDRDDKRPGDVAYPTTGQTRVYMNVGIDGNYTDGEVMTFAQAEELAQAILNAVRTGRAHDNLINPNRYTAEQVEAAKVKEAAAAVRVEKGLREMPAADLMESVAQDQALATIGDTDPYDKGFAFGQTWTGAHHVKPATWWRTRGMSTFDRLAFEVGQNMGASRYHTERLGRSK